MQLLIDINILFGLVATIFSYVRFTELRRLKGLKILIAGYLIGVVSIVPSSPLWGDFAVIPDTFFAFHIVLTTVAVIVLLWQLVTERVVQAAYYDLESSLPGRSQWHKTRTEIGATHSAWRVTFSDIETVRKLSNEDAERAFFRLLGDTLTEVQEMLPGYVARVSLRDLGWLIPHTTDEPKLVLEAFVEEQRRACRSGGFEFSFIVVPI